MSAPAAAQTTVLDPCVPPHIAEARAQAHDTWPRVLRNGFSPLGQGLEGLEATVGLDRQRSYLFSDCPVPDVLSELKRGPDGRTSGIVSANNRSLNGDLFFQRVFFDIEILQDWAYRPPGSQRYFGNFTLRAALKTAVDGGTIMMRLEQSAIPAAWD